MAYVGLLFTTQPTKYWHFNSFFVSISVASTRILGQVHDCLAVPRPCRGLLKEPEHCRLLSAAVQGTVRLEVQAKDISEFGKSLD